MCQRYWKQNATDGNSQVHHFGSVDWRGIHLLREEWNGFFVGEGVGFKSLYSFADLFTLFALSSHTTHLLNPLDKTLFEPMSNVLLLCRNPSVTWFENGKFQRLLRGSCELYLLNITENTSKHVAICLSTLLPFEDMPLIPTVFRN